MDRFYEGYQFIMLVMKTLEMKIMQRVFLWVYLKIQKSSQGKVLVGKFWVLKYKHQTDANLEVMNDQDQLYQVDPLRVPVTENFRVIVLQRVVHSVYYKELCLASNWSYLMVKLQVPHSKMKLFFRTKIISWNQNRIIRWHYRWDRRY